MVKIHEVSTDSRLIETLPKEQQLLANRLFQEMGFEEVDESPALSGTVSQADKDFLMRTRPRPVRPISSRLYMQMNCDQTMERTKFEGGIAQQVAGELYDLVDFAPLKPESKEKVRDHLQQLKAMASRKASSLKELGEQAVACKAKIDALTPGEHFVMEGGWKGQGGSPGHAMLYLFKKNADGKYSLLVFNTGEGVQFHQLEIDGIKQKSFPYLEFTGIEGEKITASFLEALLYPNQSCSAYEGGAQEIYQLIQMNLPGCLVAPQRDPLAYILGQRAGTCVLKVQLAVLRYVLEPDEYKHLVNYFSIQSGLCVLNDCYKRELEENSNAGHTFRLFTLIAARNLTHMSIKLRRKGEEDAVSKQALVYAEAIVEKVMHIETRLGIENSQAPRVFTEVQGLYRSLQSPPTCSLPLHQEAEFAHEMAPLKSYEFSSAAEITVPLIEELLANLARNFSNRNLFTSQIEMFVKAIPVPVGENSNFWNAVEEDQIHPLLGNLNAVLQAYGTRFSNIRWGFLTPCNRQTLLVLYISMRSLCMRVDKDLVQAYGIKDIVDQTDPALLAFTKEESQREVEIDRYIRDQPPTSLRTSYNVKISPFNPLDLPGGLRYFWNYYQNIEQHPDFYRFCSKKYGDRQDFATNPLKLSFLYFYAENFVGLDPFMEKNLLCRLRLMQQANCCMIANFGKFEVPFKDYQLREDNFTAFRYPFGVRNMGEAIFEVFIGTRDAFDPQKLVKLPFKDRRLERSLRGDVPGFVEASSLEEIDENDRRELAAYPTASTVLGMFLKHAHGHSRLQSADLAHYAKRYFESLSNPDVRRHFEHQFFKRFYEHFSSQMEHIVSEELEKDNFKELTLRLFSEAVQYFELGIESEMVEVGLFHMRLAIHLLELCGKNPKLKEYRSDLIEVILQFDGLFHTAKISIELQSLVILHRVLFHTVVLGTEDEQAPGKVLLDWISMMIESANLEDHPELRYIFRMVVERMLPQMEEIVSRVGEAEQKKLCRRLFEKEPDSVSVEGTSMTFTHREAGRDRFATVQFLSGYTCDFAGRGGSRFAVDTLKASGEYRRVFGNEEHVSFKREGREFYIFDSRGEYRAYMRRGDQAVIEKKIGGSWYRSLDSKEVKRSFGLTIWSAPLKSAHPLSLHVNTLAWASTSGDAETIFTDKKSGAIRYRCGREIHSDFGVHRPHLLNAAESIVARIENPFFTEMTECEGAFTLKFPRFKALEFCLDPKTGNWLWGHDRSYILSTAVVPAILGYFEHFLLLKSTIGAQDIAIVPEAEFLYDEGCKSFQFDVCDCGEMEKIRKKEQYTDVRFEKFFEGQKLGSKQCHAIPLSKSGEFEPTSPEQSLMAAYIYLGMRRFDRAFTCLKQVSQSDTERSKRAKGLLERFCAFCDEFSNGGEVTALNLHGLLMLKGADPMRTYLKYLRDLGNIPAFLRISMNQELQLLSASAVRGNTQLQNRRGLLLEGKVGDITSLPYSTSPLAKLEVAYPNRASFLLQFAVSSPEPSPLEKSELTFAKLMEQFGQRASLSMEYLGRVYVSLIKFKEDPGMREQLKRTLLSIMVLMPDKASCALFLHHILMSSATEPKWTYEPDLTYKSNFMEATYQKIEGFRKWCNCLTAAHAIPWNTKKSIENHIVLGQAHVPIAATTYPSLVFPTKRQIHRPELLVMRPLNKAEGVYTRELERVSATLATKSVLRPIFEHEENFEQAIRELQGVDDPKWSIPFEAERREFLEGYKETIAKRKSQVIPNISIQELEGELKQLQFGFLGRLKACQKEEEELLALANRTHSTKEAMDAGLSRVGGIERKLKVTDLLFLFFVGEKGGYRTHCPYLTGEEIDELYQRTANYLRNAIEFQQLERISEKLVKVCQKAEQLRIETTASALDGNLVAQHPELVELLFQLREMAHQRLALDDPDRLVFEYTMHVVLRTEPDQVASIKFIMENVLKGENSILQVRPGGGKTSVVAAYFLALMVKRNLLSEKALRGSVEGASVAGEPSVIPILMTPSFQLQTISSTLRSSLKKGMQIEVIPMSVTRAELTLNKLKEVLRVLEGIEQGVCSLEPKVLVCCPDLVQILELEFRHTCRQLIRGTDPDTVAEDFQRAEVLRQVMCKFRQSGVALGDEVHVLLDVNFEINFPMGEEVVLDRSCVAIAMEILKQIHVSFRDVLHMATNEQAKYFNLQRYRDVVLPAVADKVSKNPLLQISEGQERNRLKRYVKGEMNWRVQHAFNENKPLESLYTQQELAEEGLQLAVMQDDLQFIKYLNENLRASDISEEQQAAQLIALTKYLLVTLIPYQLSKSANVQYGRSRDPDLVGKVVPFVCADTPSVNEFGNPDEAMNYHGFTASIRGIEKAQLQRIFDDYHSEAQWYVGNRRVPYRETPPVKECLELFGTVPRPGQYDIDEMLYQVMGNADLLFAIEAKTLLQYVRFSPERLNADALAPPSLLRRFVGMSGTPTERVLHPSLQQNLHLDKSVNTDVVHIVMSKQRPIEVFRSKDPEGIVREVLASEQRPTGLIDAGSHFKDVDNLSVAHWCLKYLKSEEMQAVVFFTRAYGSTTSDYPAVLRQGDTEPELLEDLTSATLRKHNLRAGDFFLFLDKRHSEGTDVPATASARYALLYGWDLSTDDATQANMRLRRLMIAQSSIYFLSESEMGLIPGFAEAGNERDRHLALLRQALLMKVKKQGPKIEKIYIKMFANVILNAVRNCMTKEELTPERMHTLEKIFTAFQRYIFIQNERDYFRMHGSLEKEEPTLDYLGRYQAAMFRWVENAVKEHKLPVETLEEIRLQHQDVLDLAKQNQERFAQLTTQPLGHQSQAVRESDVEMEAHAEVQKHEVTLTIEREVELEINNMQLPQAERLYTHPAFYPEVFIQDEKGAIPNGSVTLKEAFGKEFFERGYQKPYGEIFADNLRVSREYMRPYFEKISFLNRSMPPFKYMLVLRDEANQYKGVVVSQRQATALKRYIETNRVQNVWLTLPGRELHAGLGRDIDWDHLELEELMVQMNLMAGNFDYCFRHLRAYHAWLTSDAVNRSLVERYIKLMYLRYPGTQSEHHLKLAFVGQVEELMERENEVEANKGAMGLANAHDIAEWRENNARQIPQLPPGPMIKSVPIPLVGSLLPNQIPYISFEQAPHVTGNLRIVKIPLAHIKMLTMEMVSEVFVRSLSRDQLKVITDAKMIPHIDATKHAEINPKLAPHIPNLSKHIQESDHDQFLVYASDVQLQEWIRTPNSQVRAHKIKSGDVIARLINLGYTNWSREQIASLSEEELLKLPDAMLGMIDLDRVSRITNPALLARLPAGHLAHLANHQVSLLNEVAINKLRQERLITRLDYSQLWHLNPMQLQFASVMQQVAYVVSVFVEALVSLLAYPLISLAQQIGTLAVVKEAQAYELEIQERLKRWINLMSYAMS